MKRLFILTLFIFFVPGSVRAKSAQTYEWVKNPLVVEIEGCKRVCIGISRLGGFSASSVMSTKQSEVSFVACDAVDDGTVCPGASDCRKAGYKLNPVVALESDLKNLTQTVSERHQWIGQPVVFSPTGCSRRLCGGTDELLDLNSKTSFGYTSPLCETAASGQCPGAVNCAYENTPGAKLLRLTRVLEDGVSPRVPAVQAK